MLDILANQLARRCLGPGDGVEAAGEQTHEKLIIVGYLVEEEDALDIGEGYEDVSMLVIPCRRRIL